MTSATDSGHRPSRPPADPRPSSSITQIVKQVSPAIVEITADDGNGSGDQGTGMIITSTGEVLTNDHVIDGATSMTVALNNSTKQLPATRRRRRPGQGRGAAADPERQRAPHRDLR